MSLATGTLSYLRFLAETVPAAFEVPFCDAMHEQRFRDIDPDGDLEQARGWVAWDDVFAAEFDPAALVSPSGHLLLRMRIDTLKVPAVTLKAYTEQAGRERARAANRDRLTKRELDALKLEVKKRLRKRSLAKLQLIEADWNVQTGEVRLLSTSKATATAFVELFEKTFALKLMPVGLRNVLWLRGFQQEELDRLDALEPERFHLIPA